MKYYLVVNKGLKYTEKERYIKLDLTNIHSKLVTDNNLKAIDLFTQGFQNGQELKQFLIKKNILSTNISHYELCILYNRKGYHSVNISYAKDAKYFDIEAIAEIVINNLYKNNKINIFLDFFKKEKYLPESYHLLKQSIINFSESYIVLDRVRQFLDDYCKTSLSIHRVAMVISKIVENNKKLENRKETEARKEHLTEIQQFELDELNAKKESKDDNQLILFKM